MTNDRRVAIVTGSARGIGRAIALRLAKDGLDVVVSDLPGTQTQTAAVVGECAAFGGRAISVECDVCDEGQVANLVAQAAEQLGRVDVMVANAGIGPPAAFLDTTPKMMDQLWAVNVRGVMFCYQAAARQMIKQGGGGKLIAACSIAGTTGFPQLAMYSATKFAVRGLNQSAAVELGKHGITCNVYCPAIVETPMWDDLDGFFSSQSGGEKGSALAAQRAANPIGRNSTPEDVSNVVSFLAGPDSGYVSGSALHISGALQMW